MGLIERFKKQAPELAKPPVADRRPQSSSGRGHTAGFIDTDEWNPDLVHPTCHDIYDEMYFGDGDVKQVSALTQNPILAGTWEVQPYGGDEATDEDVKVAEFVKWALFEQMAPNLLGHLAEFLPVLFRSGFAPGEKTWMSVDYQGERKLVLRNIGLRLPKTIQQFEQNVFGDLTRIKQYLLTPLSTVIAREGQNKNQNVDGDTPGHVWHNMKDLIYYRVGIEGDNWAGRSLLRPAYKHWYLKDKIEKIDAIAQEREALGIPICYPPMGATEPQLTAMESILQNVRANEEGYIVAPGPKAGAGMAPEGQGWLIEILGYDRTGSGRDPQPSLEYHSLKIAAAFMAEFMRLGHGGGGSRAVGQVQVDPHLQSIEAITSTIIEPQIKWGMVLPLVAYNFPNIENLPTVKMSLVDSTSLQQLADFVQKLVQVGVLMPDQELENFLRARADLPQPNPKSVKKRGEQDEKLRAEVVNPAPPPVAPGVPSGPGGKSKPGKPHGTKPAKGMTAGGARGGPNRNTATETADSISDDVTMLAYHNDRYYHREPRHYELPVDLASIEDHFDENPDIYQDACAKHVMEMAKGMTGDSSAVIVSPSLRDTILSLLSDGYEFGRSTVRSELGVPAQTLDRGARDRSGALAARADMAAEAVAHAIKHSASMADLHHGQKAGAQAAAEKAGNVAVKHVAQGHGTSAFLHGRHDQATELADSGSGFHPLGVRYSAILDHSTCRHCREADDGQVRDFDDPIRLERMPPNPHCESTASGRNMCRCFETYEKMDAAISLSTLDDSTPDFIRSVFTELVDRGQEPSRALSAAQQLAEVFCRTGKMPWPGLASLGLTRAAACDAAGWQ